MQWKAKAVPDASYMIFAAAKMITGVAICLRENIVQLGLALKIVCNCIVEGLFRDGRSKLCWMSLEYSHVTHVDIWR